MKFARSFLLLGLSCILLQCGGRTRHDGDGDGDGDGDTPGDGDGDGDTPGDGDGDGGAPGHGAERVELVIENQTEDFLYLQWHGPGCAEYSIWLEDPKSELFFDVPFGFVSCIDGTCQDWPSDWESAPEELADPQHALYVRLEPGEAGTFYLEHFAAGDLETFLDEVTDVQFVMGMLYDPYWVQECESSWDECKCVGNVCAVLDPRDSQDEEGEGEMEIVTFCSPSYRVEIDSLKEVDDKVTVFAHVK